MDVDIDLVISLYKQGMSYIQIGEHLGLGGTAISKRLRKAGFCPGKGHHHPFEIALPMVEIAAKYQAGESTVSLGKEYGVTAERMRRKLRSYGVQMRSHEDSRARGKRNSQWKGGKSANRADMHHQVRWFVEELLGLQVKLPRKCIVHHIDENTRNNSVENLALFVGFGSHLQHHQRLLKSQYRDCPKEASQLLLESGGVLLQSLLDQIRYEPGTNPLDLLERMAMQQPGLAG